MSIPKQVIPRKTVYRLSLYYRSLQRLRANKVETVSSAALAKASGVKPTQLRKDLTYFGEFGVRGVGYSVAELRKHLSKILGLETFHRIGIVGAGNLGMALANYRGFDPNHFQVAALFDRDLSRVGETSRSGVFVYHIKDLKPLVARENISIGVICVPADNAQEVADLFTDAGITAILNFAPVRLTTEPGVKLKTMDLAISFESLSYFIAKPTYQEAAKFLRTEIRDKTNPD